MEAPTVDNPKTKKKPKRSATPKQRRLYSLLLDNAESPKPESIRALALAAGYSESAANNPERAILSRPTFQNLLDLIDDDELLAKAREIALDDDKRASLAAIDMLLKLKDRFPANKLKLSGYQDELGALEDDAPTDTSAPLAMAPEASPSAATT